MLQETMFQDQVLKLCKFVQKTTKEVLDFKARQLASIEISKAVEARCSIASSTDKFSIEVYEKQIFSSDFHPIHVYMFGLSVLITLNIYKDYFKGRQKECEAKLCSCKL